MCRTNKQDLKKVYKLRHINAKPYDRAKNKKDFQNYKDEEEDPRL